MKRKVIIGLILGLMCHTLAKDFYQLRKKPGDFAQKSAISARLMTDKSKYNSFDHAGLQSGKLDIERFPFSARLSGRLYSSEQDSTTSKYKNFYLPSFDLGTPFSKVFSGYYNLQPKKMFISDTSKTIDHHFGLAFATQTDDKTFRFAFDFGGAAGTEKASNADDGKRVYRSLDNFELVMGSKPSDFVTLSIAGGADAVFDSINYNDIADRFFEITLPRITFTTDLGDSTIPYRSTFSFSYGRRNFVYSTDGASGLGIKSGSGDGNQDADAIISDSTNWHWMNMWDIEVADEFQIHPAFDLGFMHNRHKRMNPGSKNHPFAYDGEAEGYTWEEKSFVWGIGTSFTIVQFIDLFTEFSRNTLTLDLTGNNMSGDVKDNDGYNRLMTGFSMGFHDIESADFGGNKLFFDFSFLRLNENALYNRFYGSSNFHNLFGLNSGSQLLRYNPLMSYDTEVKTNRVGFGIRGVFKEGQVETDFNIGFVNQTLTSIADSDYEESNKGIELNFDIIYNVFSFSGK